MNVFIHDNEIHSKLSLINTYLFLDKWYILGDIFWNIKFCKCNLATWFYNFYFHDVNLIPKTNIHVDYEFSIRWPRPHNIIMITTWNGDLHNNVWRGDVDDEKMYSCNLKKTLMKHLGKMIGVIAFIACIHITPVSLYS